MIKKVSNTKDVFKDVVITLVILYIKFCTFKALKNI